VGSHSNLEAEREQDHSAQTKKATIVCSANKWKTDVA
jgi:hypothetical protein